jgi:hypothetical protein
MVYEHKEVKQVNKGVIAKRKYRSQTTQANVNSLHKQSISNIELEKESNTKVIDKFSSIDDNKDHNIAVNILNTHG